MRFNRIRVLIAGAVAFFFGFPLSEKAFASSSGIVDSSLGLAMAIIDSAKGS